jgi:ATPase family associated with various cellular activities (AAA)
MRREPSLTFEGALRILERYEPRLIRRLDAALGGVILAAGAAAGAAAIGAPALAPLGMFAAVWGFTEQKNQAVDLLHQAVSAVSGKLVGTRGYERRQLISAAHTTIVVAAFFEAFRQHAGEEFFARLEISEAEKERLLAGHFRRQGETVYDVLYAAEIAAPSPTRGFEENVDTISDWLADFAEDFADFLDGLAAAEDSRFDWSAIHDRAVERYRSYFLSLAAKVPEFMIWAMLGEGAATRAAVTELRADVAEALDANRDALGRVESLLALDTARDETITELRAAVARANSGVLEQPIIPEGASGYGPDITFPATGEIYINPHYRLVIPSRDARLADDQWWDGRAARDDFDVMLAAHVVSPDATRLPMLLLGHPGSGKSMLTKVLAARLPVSAYTVVRVSLRRVGTNTPVVNQIEEALALATNRRVDSWWRLAEQSEGTTRVVLLDGLDELLQATRNDRGGYLHDVMEFQRREAEQQRPVVVIVTSRTVVADRANVPPGSPVVKLDEFKKPDIEDWLTRWRSVNAAAIATGKVRELTADCVPGSPALEQQHQEEGSRGGSVWDLARQPLLLLMLALYAADPELPPLRADMDTGDLYQHLLESFARREAAKDIDRGLHGDELEVRVQDHLERLAVAALAMFNRGRQDIGEEELGADLVALDPDPRSAGERSRPVEAGQRVVGEFLFIHASEARALTGLGGLEDNPQMSSRREPLRRTYEFLHATFGEYLVASRVMSELAEVATKAFAGRRGPVGPDDDLLYALLSHQPLAARRSTLTFAQEIFGGLSDKDRANVLDVLEVLLGAYRYRHGSHRYAAYRPTPLDRVRELACYCANLVALRVMLGGSISLHGLLPIRDDDTPLEQWRSTVRLWEAGLSADGLESMLATVRLSGTVITAGPNPVRPTVHFTDEASPRDITLARLVGDRLLEGRLRYGSAITAGYMYRYDEDNEDWVHVTASCLITAIAGVGAGFIVTGPPPGTSDDDIRVIAQLIFKYLRKPLAGGGLSPGYFLKVLFNLPMVFDIDAVALAATVLSSPELLEEVPELRASGIYGPYAVFLDGLLPGVNRNDFPVEAVNAGRQILTEWVRESDPWYFTDFG